ncbi:MAG: hypothetical protein GY754_09955 [bacterium]|nr:hypothetical protein [bacterium]
MTGISKKLVVLLSSFLCIFFLSCEVNDINDINEGEIAAEADINGSKAFLPDESPRFSSSAVAVPTVVSFKSVHGKYLVAEKNGGNTVNANRTRIGSWEKFTLDAPGPVMDGNKIHIRTSSNYYFCAESNGNLVANRRAARSWETFTLINHSNPGGPLRNNDTITLKSCHNKYVVAESNGKANANRTRIGSWERFTVVAHSLPSLDRGNNAALGKSSSQSSTGYSGSSSRAVDGNTSGTWGHGSVTHTARTTSPWWSVDLGAAHRVTGVTLWNRTDCCSSRLANFRVEYLDANGSLITYWNHSGTAGTRTDITLPASGVHSVRVRLNGTQYLSLAEVQVWGELYSMNPTEQRKIDFRDMVLDNNPSGSSPMGILAYEGIPISDADIDGAINSFKTKETGDFRLAQIVRVLCLTDEYDHKLLPALEESDFWLTKGEDLYCLWSENHMILWTSSAYLLKQREGWEMDPTMESRLKHYLDLKLKYGFYEFFSSTYLPFTLGALLNLADFAEDGEIKAKATLAAQKLMKNWLLMVNDKGAFYPVAGRNYSERYTSFGSSSITWINSGLGPMRTSCDYAGSFLATSSIDLSDVEASWSNSLNTTFKFGHSQGDKLTVHAGQTRVDRTVFQWSSGGYFHPDVANDTTWLVDEYNLENNHHFEVFKSIPNFPDKWSNGFSKIGAVFSRGSSISQATIKIYKNKGVVLTSLENFYPGYRGYQQWPWAATVDDIAVWTQAQDISAGWKPESRLSANTHLPKIQQNGNVALITYFPKIEIRTAQWLGKYDTFVTLHWPEDRFDESFGHGKWIIGRKGDSYIAVYRYGTGKRNGYYYSNANRGRQMWAVIVGNKNTHGSFGSFVNIVKAAKISESYPFVFKEFRRVYKTGISIDGKSISNRW